MTDRAQASSEQIRRTLSARGDSGGVPVWAQGAVDAAEAIDGQGGSVRRTVTFSEQAWETLTRPGKTPADRIRDGLALMRFFDQAERDGDRILLERPGRLVGRRLYEISLS